VPGTEVPLPKITGSTAVSPEVLAAVVPFLLFAGPTLFPGPDGRPVSPLSLAWELIAGFAGWASPQSVDSSSNPTASGEALPAERKPVEAAPRLEPQGPHEVLQQVRARLRARDPLATEAAQALGPDVESRQALGTVLGFLLELLLERDETQWRTLRRFADELRATEMRRAEVVHALRGGLGWSDAPKVALIGQLLSVGDAGGGPPIDGNSSDPLETRARLVVARSTIARLSVCDARYGTLDPRFLAQLLERVHRERGRSNGLGVFGLAKAVSVVTGAFNGDTQKGVEECFRDAANKRPHHKHVAESIEAWLRMLAANQATAATGAPEDAPAGEAGVRIDEAPER
jgi:hypothetical protein